jgi:hypothetical protein
MKHTRSTLALIMIFILLAGLSCSQRGNQAAALSPTPRDFPETEGPGLTNPQDWTPPVFPDAVSDEDTQANMTAVASTPQALDETACICFGFPVHDAVFHAYRSEADVQTIMDFYSKEMAAQGWKKIAVDLSDSKLPHQIWQLGKEGPLVVYLMVAPMEEDKMLIYLSIAKSDTPQKVMEE